MITEKDIYMASCGRNDEGDVKALVKVETAIISERSTDTIDNIVMDEPEVNMIKTRSFTMIDLKFNSKENYELNRLFKMLTSFCSVENMMDEERGEIPAICISICPREYNGEYVVTGMHAMWTLNLTDLNGEADTIRFIVENGFMHAYQVNMDEVDMP